MAKRALITGVTGQDGSYLAEFLLSQGYEVCGMVRRSSTLNFERIGPLRGLDRDPVAAAQTEGDEAGRGHARDCRAGTVRALPSGNFFSLWPSAH